MLAHSRLIDFCGLGCWGFAARSEELLFDDFTVVAAVADSENAAAENNATSRYDFSFVSSLRMHAAAQA
jgi:hypothetical protein